MTPISLDLARFLVILDQFFFGRLLLAHLKPCPKMAKFLLKKCLIMNEKLLRDTSVQKQTKYLTLDQP